MYGDTEYDIHIYQDVRNAALDACTLSERNIIIAFNYA